MTEKFPYAAKLDIEFKYLDFIDIPAIIKDSTEKWFNQMLTKVNENVVRVGVFQGEYHWHKHDNDDEFFFVLEGQLLIDIQDRVIELNPHQGVTILKDVIHRLRAPHKTVVLIMGNQRHLAY